MTAQHFNLYSTVKYFAGRAGSLTTLANLAIYFTTVAHLCCFRVLSKYAHADLYAHFAWMINRIPVSNDVRFRPGCHRDLSQTSRNCRLRRSVDLVFMAAKGSTESCVWSSLFPFISYQSCTIRVCRDCCDSWPILVQRCYLATCRDPKQPGKASPPLVTLPCPRREAI